MKLKTISPIVYYNYNHSAIMDVHMENMAAVILAAGRGTRLNCADRPKVMLEIGGRPIVSYIVETLENLGFNRSLICLVVGFRKERIKEYFGNRVVYASQDKQLGTAHAALTGIVRLPKEIKNVVVLGGDDSAFYTKEGLKNFINKHTQTGAVLSLLTVESKDPSSLGRIIRGANGEIICVVEKEELNEEQKKIKEISTGAFCFNREWFERAYPLIRVISGLGEYGLPDTLRIAVEQGKKVQAIKLKHREEWFGINTLEELEEADKRKRGA